MIKSLRDARITDALPRVVSTQEWVKALALALSEVHKTTLNFADKSQIYTEIDNASEPVLDALAVNWKIDWYDTTYSLDKKRRIVKTAMDVRRLMGTAQATRTQADAIYPGTMLEEWFEYGGEAGYFRLSIDITGSAEENSVILSDPEEMERQLTAAKRWSTHMESLSYMVKHALVTNPKVEKWIVRLPICGTVYCGTWWIPATLGRSEGVTLKSPGMAEGYVYQPEFAGTLPQVAVLGRSERATLRTPGGTEGYVYQPELVGVETTGTLPEFAAHGYSVCGATRCSGVAEGFAAATEYSGTTHCGVKP